MNDRTNIKNLLLLSVLTGILLISGSLQCAFDCLTPVDGRQSILNLHTQNPRVDSCHSSYTHDAPPVSCLNKACHQRLPLQHNLDGPEIYRLESLPQPLFSNSRQAAPQYRAGDAIIVPPLSMRQQHRLLATTSRIIPQRLSSLRTTVLIC